MLDPVLQFVGRFTAKEVHTTYLSFRLITRITVNILFFIILAIFSTAFMLDNKVIECHTSNGEIKPLATTICWAEGVFIDRNYLNGTVGLQVVAPGVGIKHKDTNFIHQSYYQWIAPLILLHAFILYLPRGLWKLFEGGVMRNLIGDNDGPIVNEKWKEKRNFLVSYMRNVNKKYHRFYVIKYFFCEVLSMAAIVLNMFTMKWVINDFWVEYQPAIVALLRGSFVEFRRQSAVLFPLQAKCIFHTFGHTGTVQNHDVLCYMSLNVLNEKVFIFLYFWYIALLLFAVLNIIHLFSMLCFNNLRIIDIGRMCERSATRRECRKISDKGDFGLWFTLKIFRRNLSPVLYQDLVKALTENIPDLPKFSFHNDDDHKY